MIKQKLKKIVNTITIAFIIIGVLSIIAGIIQVFTDKLDFLFYLNEVGSFIIGAGFIVVGIIANRVGYEEIKKIKDDDNTSDEQNIDEKNNK